MLKTGKWGCIRKLQNISNEIMVMQCIGVYFFLTCLILICSFPTKMPCRRACIRYENNEAAKKIEYLSFEWFGRSPSPYLRRKQSQLMFVRTAEDNLRG